MKFFHIHITYFVPLASVICLAMEKCEIDLDFDSFVYQITFSLSVSGYFFFTLCINQCASVGNKICPRWHK